MTLYLTATDPEGKQFSFYPTLQSVEEGNTFVGILRKSRWTIDFWTIQ